MFTPLTPSLPHSLVQFQGVGSPGSRNLFVSEYLTPRDTVSPFPHPHPRSDGFKRNDKVFRNGTFGTYFVGSFSTN